MGTTKKRNHTPMKQRRHAAACVLAAAMTAACSVPSSAPNSAADRMPPMRAHGVTIYGYNYTNRGFGSFEVNGHGGGNLFVSTPTAGGGKHTCCATVFAPTNVEQPFTIKWTQEDGIWCEQNVTLPPVRIVRPKYIEVHFYPDGHIELAATEGRSEPRLKLEAAGYFSRHTDSSKNRIVIHESTRCRDGYF